MITNTSCPCPLGSSLTDVPNITCGVTFGQIQKVIFQRLRNEDGERNKFGSTEPIASLSSWSPLLVAEDSTKIVVSPYIQAPTDEVGAARTFGGGNETLGGLEEIIGREPTKFNGVIRKAPQSVIKALKAFQCESSANNLGIYLVDGNGAIECLEDPANKGVYYPIPIRSLFVGDKAHGGLEAPDSNTIQWGYLPNYSDDLQIITPDFNPLTDLVVIKKVEE